MNVEKILLIHPEISRNKYNFGGIIENEPLELEYIYTMLKEENYDVNIFDVAREKISVEEKLNEYKPTVVYICGRIKQENFIKEHVSLAKKINKGIMTIVGGIHAQHNYKRLYAEELDYVSRSFDIFVIRELVHLKQGLSVDINTLNGLCYKRDGEWVENAIEPFDIKRLPLPDRSYFYEHLNHYRYLELSPCAHIRTAYSCVFQCKFCYRSSMNFGKYVIKDIEDVVDEIKTINCENIYIIDDNFLIDKRRIRKFIDLIKRDNIKKKFVCFGRADFIVRNKELVKELKEIGFYYILVGLEGIEDNKLNSYDKRTSADWNKDCVNFLNEIGINIMGMFIVDLDFEKRDFKNMYKWIKENKLKHVAISVFTPIPSTKLFEEYENKLITHNPEHFDYLHLVSKPTKLSIKRYYFYYYLLLIKLMLRGKRQGIYNFLNYNEYIRHFAKAIFKRNKR